MRKRGVQMLKCVQRKREGARAREIESERQRFEVSNSKTQKRIPFSDNEYFVCVFLLLSLQSPFLSHTHKIKATKSSAP
jgi:hypothetical protein